MIDNTNQILEMIEHSLEIKKEKLRSISIEILELEREIIDLERAKDSIKNNIPHLEVKFDRSYEEQVETLRRSLVMEALRKTKGNIYQAAELMQTSRSNLIAMIDKYQIDVNLFKMTHEIQLT